MKKRVQSVLFSVLVGALLLCAGCGKSGDIYTAGVYTASAEGGLMEECPIQQRSVETAPDGHGPAADAQ